MEEIPFSLPSPEEDDDDDDDGVTKKSKKKSFLEDVLEVDNKDKKKIGKEIAKSIFQNPKAKEELEDKDDNKEKVKESSEKSEEISADEEAYINQAIANEHLQNPVTEEAPEPPVNEFLDRVVDGEDPNGAYDETINHIEQPEQVEQESPEHQSSVTEQESIAEEPVVDSPIVENTPLQPIENIQTVDPIMQQPELAQSAYDFVNARNSAMSSQSPSTSEVSSISRISKVESDQKKASSVPLVSELTAYIIGKRVGKKQSKEKAIKTQKRLEKKVQQMEKELTVKELALQQIAKNKNVQIGEQNLELIDKPNATLVKERPVDPIRSTTLPERATSRTMESRLKLSKPELRAERLGQVSIAAQQKPIEKMMRPNSIKEYFRPEHVRTMRRQDLLDVSEKILVEGASLKHMYDNNLFSERALRRLVSEYLAGKDIMPHLREEILEKQIDYERDPLLRDRKPPEKKTAKNVFDYMLAGTRSVQSQDSQQASGEDLRQKTDKNKKIDKAKPLNTTKTASNIFFIIFLIIIIALIIYLLLKG